MSIDFANLQYQYQRYKEEIDTAIHRVLDRSGYIMGEEVADLEHRLQQFTGVKHAISCSSGTDALILAMMALNIGTGDEVITTPFTFIATAESIAFLGAKPVFVDIDERTYNIDSHKIEEKITSKTKAIMPVSLFGQPANMTKIQQIADKYALKIIVDGAQSFGATFLGKADSALGDIATTSFFPAKPLGCFGDGGAVFTNDDTLAEKIRALRIHGQTKRYTHRYIGIGGRMDTLQCAVVNVKLKYYKEDLFRRQQVAARYTEVLKGKNLILPFVDERCTSTWAQYSIRVLHRDVLRRHMEAVDIPVAVHYPLPLHLQEAFVYLGYAKGDFPVAEQICDEIISLPMNPYLNESEIEMIGGHII